MAELGGIAKFTDLGHEIYVLTVAGHLPPLYEKKDYELTFMS